MYTSIIYTFLLNYISNAYIQYTYETLFAYIQKMLSDITKKLKMLKISNKLAIRISKFK